MWGRQKDPLVFGGDAVFPLFEWRDSRLSEIREFRNMRRDFNDYCVNLRSGILETFDEKLAVLQIS